MVNTQIFLSGVRVHPRALLVAGGRFLIVASFPWEAWRLFIQWDDHIWYLKHHRKFSPPAAYFLFGSTVLILLASSTLLIVRRHIKSSVAILLGHRLMNDFGYGVRNSQSSLRILNILGGLSMIFLDAAHSQQRLSQGKIKHTKFVTVARLLLIGMYIAFMFHDKHRWTEARLGLSAAGFAATVLIALSFSSRFSSVTVLGIVLLLSHTLHVIESNKGVRVHRHAPRVYDPSEPFVIIGTLILLDNMRD